MLFFAEICLFIDRKKRYAMVKYGHAYLGIHKYKSDGNCSAGLRIQCAEREKITSPKAENPARRILFHGFSNVIMKVLNNYK